MAGAAVSERAQIMRARALTCDLVTYGSSDDQIQKAKQATAFLVAKRDIRKIVSPMSWLTDDQRSDLAAIITTGT